MLETMKHRRKLGKLGQDGRFGVLQQPVGTEEQRTDLLSVFHYIQALFDLSVFAFLQLRFLKLIKLELQIVVFCDVFRGYFSQIVQLPLDAVVSAVVGPIIGQQVVVSSDFIQQMQLEVGIGQQ